MERKLAAPALRIVLVSHTRPEEWRDPFHMSAIQENGCSGKQSAGLETGPSDRPKVWPILAKTLPRIDPHPDLLNHPRNIFSAEVVRIGTNSERGKPFDARMENR